MSKEKGYYWFGNRGTSEKKSREREKRGEKDAKLRAKERIVTRPERTTHSTQRKAVPQQSRLSTDFRPLLAYQSHFGQL